MSLITSSRIRLVVRKAVAVFLALSLFSNYALAAPEAARELVVRASETARDAQSDLAAIPIGSFLNGLAYNFFFFFRDKQEKPEVTRIEVSPGSDLNIRQGQPVNFVAIGYDAKDIPVGGVKVEWTIKD